MSTCTHYDVPIKQCPFCRVPGKKGLPDPVLLSMRSRANRKESMHTTQNPERKTESEKNLDEFMARLEDLIKFTSTHRFKGATQAFRALRRVKTLSIFK